MSRIGRIPARAQTLLFWSVGSRNVRTRALAFAVAGLLVAQVVAPAVAQAPAAAPANSVTISGTIVDRSSGTSVSGVGVTLFRGSGEKVTAIRSDNAGNFRFEAVASGVYYVQIAALGYEPVRTEELFTASGQTSGFRVSLVRARNSATSNGLSEIGRVSVSRTSGNGSLATSTTINQTVSSELLQREGYVRIGEGLGTLSGVNLNGLSSSVGDSLSIDIRGFGTSETQTLVDGHPIGPQGAGTGGFDFQNGPTYAIASTQVTYGSGALGLYGTSAIGGTVDMQTINPTRQPELTLSQGVGYEGRRFTSVVATGTLLDDKLGYALVNAVDGTYGPFKLQDRSQPSQAGNNFSRANQALYTYGVSQDYLLRNDLFKLKYSFSKATSFEATALSANSFDDKTGNGDNCYQTEGQALFNAQSTSANPSAYTVNLTNGTTLTVNCPAGQLGATTDDTTATCLPAGAYAKLIHGNNGGGPGAYQAHRLHDYHGRLQTRAGNSTLTLDGFGTRESTDYSRAVGSAINSPGSDTQFFDTTGLLVSDDIAGRTNDFGFGYFVEHQRQTGTFLQQLSDGSFVNWNGAGKNPGAVYALGERNFFIRDQYTPDGPLSIFLNAWLKRSTVTGKQTFDPRLSFVYHATPSDVVRLTGGRSDAAPGPSLLTGPIIPNTTPSNITPACSVGQFTIVGDSSNPSLIQETSSDLEVGYGHRFHGDSVVNAAAYYSFEKNRIFSDVIPVTSVAFTLPQNLLTQYYARIASFCGQNAPQTLSVLGYNANVNAGATRYQGVEIAGRYRLNRNLFADYSYDVQSAANLGIPDRILQNNVTLINGAQLQGISLHKGSFGLDLQNGRGFEARIDSYYQGDYNPYHRDPFFYANASLTQQVSKNTSFNIGVLNVFNSVASKYYEIGAGRYQAENQFGTDGGNIYAQQSNQTGLLPITAVLSVTTHI